MNKVLASISIAMFSFLMLCMFVLWKYREELFQVRSRLFICGLLSVELLFVMIHYSLGLPSTYSIVFVIIQEYFKISAFLYVIFFYLKQAINYTEEDRGRKFIKGMKFSFIIFIALLAVTLSIWAILRATHLIHDLPCRDWTWLLYRSLALIMVVTVIFVGLFVQRRVIHKTDRLVASNNTSIINSIDEIEKEYSDKILPSTDKLAGKFYLTSSFQRRKKAIQKTLKHMWI